MSRLSLYIDESALAWLLEQSHPAIRYLTRKEVLSDSDIESDYSAMKDYVNARISVLKKKKRFDAAEGLAATVAFAAECGVRSDEQPLAALIDQLLKTAYLPDGSFSLDWRPRRGCAAWTASVLKNLLRCGYSGNSIETSAHYLAAAIRHDGGWLGTPVAGTRDLIRLVLFNRSGTGLKREHLDKVPSSIIATACATEALLIYSNIYGKFRKEAERGAEFLLENSGRFMNGESLGIYTNTSFAQINAPLLMQTDILHILQVIRKAGKIDDERSAKLFNQLLGKMESSGRFSAEAMPTGSMGQMLPSEKSALGKWCTLNAFRLFTSLQNQTK